MPETEFRPVPPDRREEFWRIADYAFHLEAGPRDPDDDPDRIADRFGVFAGEELVSICAHYDFEARLRGEWVPLAGLAAVATPPEHRREGHVRRAVEASLERWRGDAPLAALWPFERAYYEQFGWATANTRVETTCSPDALAFGRDAPGRARPVTAEEWSTLQSVHERQALDHTLALRRADERWWRERVVGDDAYAYAWEREGETRGYVVYSVTSTGDGMEDCRISVGDLATADEGAFRGLAGFLADHDSQATEIAMKLPDARLLDYVDEPEALECTVSTGPMARVVDITDALEMVSYPPGVEADLTLAVEDGTCPWNDGRFRLQVADGTGRCSRVADGEPGAAAGSTDDADAALDVGTLSQLVVGYHSVADARRTGGTGGLSIADESVADALAALFPPETVYLRTFF